LSAVSSSMSLVIVFPSHQVFLLRRGQALRLPRDQHGTGAIGAESTRACRLAEPAGRLK
jgi:hypothetical protein